MKITLHELEEAHRKLVALGKGLPTCLRIQPRCYGYLKYLVYWADNENYTSQKPDRIFGLKIIKDPKLEVPWRIE